MWLATISYNLVTRGGRDSFRRMIRLLLMWRASIDDAVLTADEDITDALKKMKTGVGVTPVFIKIAELIYFPRRQLITTSLRSLTYFEPNLRDTE